MKQQKQAIKKQKEGQERAEQRIAELLQSIKEKAND